MSGNDLPSLDQFLSAAEYPNNSYVNEPGFRELYVRKGRRLLGSGWVSPVVDLARIEAEKPGSGAFTRLAARLRRAGYAVYVESVINSRFAEKLLAKGWIRIGSSECPSFYLLKEEQEELLENCWRDRCVLPE